MEQIYVLLCVWDHDFGKGGLVLASSKDKSFLQKLMQNTAQQIKKQVENSYVRPLPIFWRTNSETADSLEISRALPNYSEIYEYWRLVIQTVPVVKSQEEINEISNSLILF